MLLMASPVLLQAQEKKNNWKERLALREQEFVNMNAKIDQIWRFTAEPYRRKYGAKKFDKIIWYDTEDICPLCGKEKNGTK